MEPKPMPWFWVAGWLCDLEAGGVFGDVNEWWRNVSTTASITGRCNGLAYQRQGKTRCS